MPAWTPETVKCLLVAGERGLAAVSELIDKLGSADCEALDDLRYRQILRPLESNNLLAPIPQPGFVLLGGRTFRSHIAEMAAKFNMDVDSLIPEHPHGFPKDSNTVIGHHESIKLPKKHPNMVDFEGSSHLLLVRRITTSPRTKPWTISQDICF